MADEQAIIAQYAGKYGLTDEMIKHAECWTETDGDLAGLSEKRIRGILDLRFSAIAVDTPRSELWHTPDTIDVIEDLPYLPDGGYDTEAGQCAADICSTYICRMMLYCVPGIRHRCTSIYMAAVSPTGIRN